MSIIKTPHFSHPIGFYFQNSIWSFSFAITFILSLLFSFTFIPLLTCFIFSYITAIISRKFVVNKVLSVPPNAAVLITGASTGIGYDASLRLASEGFTVFATVRKDSDVESLKNAAKRIAGSSADNVIPLILEVTDSNQIENTVQQVKKHLKEKNLQFYGLVNNAGYSEAGVIELMPLESLRKQYEVNVFAPVKITQAFLPLLRECKIQGYNPRIVLVSSVVGKLSMAGNGVYCSSKHALEAIGDALRQELRKWKIHVSLVEPGAIRTSFKSTLEKGLSINLGKETAKGSPANTSPEITEYYSNAIHRMIDSFGKNTYYNEPSICSDAIESALLDSRPLPRYLAGVDAGGLPLLTSCLPQSVMDFALAIYFR